MSRIQGTFSRFSAILPTIVKYSNMVMMKFIKSKFIYITVPIIIIAIIYFGKKLLNSSSETVFTQSTSTSKATVGTIIKSVSASGQVETANYLTVTTSVNGIVKNVLVKEGDTVTKGQKIMEITLNSDGEEALQQAWASYLSAKNSLEQTKNALYSKQSALINAEEAFETEKKNNSYQSHDERVAYTLAENAYLSAKAEVDEQNAQIKHAEVNVNKAWLSYQAQSPSVVAPDSGTIANIVVTEGMNISNSLSEKTSASVASIKKEGTPIVSLNVSELDINNVKVDQKVMVELSSLEGQKFNAKVVGIDKVGTTSSGVANYPVIVRFDEDSSMVLPNMGVDAQIVLEEKTNVLIIPTSAITSSRGEKSVNVVENGVTKRVVISTGITDGTNTEVTSGLDEGAEVLLSSLPTSGFTSSNSNQNPTPGAGMFIGR